MTLPPPPVVGDVNGDGVVDVLDLIDLLLCFGLPAVPGCEAPDINADGTVDVLDLIQLLLAFGATSPCSTADAGIDQAIAAKIIETMVTLTNLCSASRSTPHG